MSRATSKTRTRAAVLGAVVGAVLLFPSAPSAQEEGVYIDPDSPAGREYAVPAEEARRDAGGADNGRGDNAPLFGEGVSGDDDGSGSSQDAGKPTNSQGTGDGGAGTSGSGPAASSTSKQDLERLAATTDDSGGNTTPLFIGIAVLLLGVTGGIVARRRRTTS